MSTNKKISDETALAGNAVDEANDNLIIARGTTANRKMKVTEMYNYVFGKLPPSSSTTLRSGSGVPSNGLGVNGDYYLDNVTGNVYLKAAGTYTVTANFKGATGATGAAGANGADGTNGANGADGTNGTNGIDGANGADGTNGINGADGAPGVGVPTGGTTGQKLVKLSNTNFNTAWVDDSSRNIVIEPQESTQ